MQFGGAVVHNISKNPKHKDRWSWHIPSKQASEFLKLVLPYLQLKRPQAELAIKYQSGKKNWGPIKTGYRSGTHKPNESYVLEEAQKLLMNRYNKKGPI